MLCSKLQCHKGFNLALVSYKMARKMVYHAERAHRLLPLRLQLLQYPARQPPQVCHHLIRQSSQAVRQSIRQSGSQAVRK